MTTRIRIAIALLLLLAAGCYSGVETSFNGAARPNVGTTITYVIDSHDTLFDGSSRLDTATIRLVATHQHYGGRKDVYFWVSDSAKGGGFALSYEPNGDIAGADSNINGITWRVLPLIRGEVVVVIPFTDTSFQGTDREIRSETMTGFGPEVVQLAGRQFGALISVDSSLSSSSNNGSFSSFDLSIAKYWFVPELGYIGKSVMTEIRRGSDSTANSIPNLVSATRVISYRLR